MSDTTQLEKQILADVTAAADETALEAVRVAALGKQGSITALLKTLQIASERYKAGYSPFLDQLDAQRNLLSVQLAVEQARADQLKAYVTLFQAMGGGWDRTLIEDSRLAAQGAPDQPR